MISSPFEAQEGQYREADPSSADSFDSEDNKVRVDDSDELEEMRSKERAR